jgi:ABC-type bacteriocin/lantibiotic exporter with double-glycine peptidase domain
LKPVQRLFRVLGTLKKEVALVYTYAAFQGLILLSLPLGIQAIIGLLFAGEVSASWGVLVGLVILGTFMAGIMQVLQLSVTEHIQQKIFTHTSFEFAFRLPRLKQKEIANRYMPELVNRFFDTLTVQKGIAKLLSDFASASIQILFGLILLAFYHPFFIAFGLVLLIILFLIIKFTGPAGLKSSITESGFKFRVAHWLEEIARVLSTFKLAGNTQLPERKTDDLVNKYLDARQQHFSILRIQFISLILFKTFIVGGLLALGSLLVLNAEINLGQFVAAEIIIILLINAVEKLILQMEPVYDVLTSLEKIAQVTDIPLENYNGTNTQNLTVNPEGITLELSKIYLLKTLGNQHALSGLNLIIPAGQKVCVAGQNGSGKSTLLKLCSGFYSDFEGGLFYNGLSFNSYKPNDLRSVIGDNLGQEDIFEGSILENITLGREGISQEKIFETINRLRLGDYIKSLPLGLENPLIPGDQRIPKSILRKIILARSIIHQPKLLLLEDSISQLDSQDRELIINYLNNIKATRIFVSNNARMAMNCDLVLILDDGKIIASGNPANIIADSRFSPIFQS